MKAGNEGMSEKSLLTGATYVSPEILRSISRREDRQHYSEAMDARAADIEKDRFMSGLKAQHDEVLRRLQEDEILLMYCYHGPEKLLVRSIYMPSANVVSMMCVDEHDRETVVTCHMHALTFRFVPERVVPPVVRIPIGFRMPF